MVALVYDADSRGHAGRQTSWDAQIEVWTARGRSLLATSDLIRLTWCWYCCQHATSHLACLQYDKIMTSVINARHSVIC